MAARRTRVKVVKPRRRKFYVLKWVDPLTGKERQESTHSAVKRVARQKASDKEVELALGGPVDDHLSWDDFVTRYTNEHLDTLAERTGNRFKTANAALKRLCRPQLLVDVDASMLSAFMARRRQEAVSAATVALDVRMLRASLGWAARIGLIQRQPRVLTTKAQRVEAGRMKGRPITEKEFEKLIKAVQGVRPDDPGIWKHLLRGLWWSGLRIGEAHRLSWDRATDFAVDLDSGRHPRFRIAAAGQKSRRDELCPMAPEFAAMLQRIPTAKRIGRVFKAAERYSFDWLVKVVSEIGQKAGVIVDAKSEMFASAHSLRRSFGTRWASRVKPAVLKRMMRHASINTTMAFYVDIETDDIGDAIASWSKGGA